jgi:hypothetical protein
MSSKEGVMERHEAGKWTERLFKITEGKLAYLTSVRDFIAYLKSSTWVFARPEKDNRKHIFGLLNVCNGKSIVLEVSVPTCEVSVTVKCCSLHCKFSGYQ